VLAWSEAEGLIAALTLIAAGVLVTAIGLSSRKSKSG
jgi:hypothetical protein